MEEGTQSNTEVAVTEAAQSIEVQSQKKEEESSLDGEFIKVEKEAFDMKRNSPITDASSRKEQMVVQEKVRGLEIELDKVTKALKSTTVELSAKDSLIDEMYKELELERISERQLKSKCAELETKLKLSEAEFGKADAFSAQVILKNAELEQKLKSLEEVVTESNSGAEETRLHLQDREAKQEAVQLKNKELEQRLTLFESKHGDTDRELKQHIEKLTGLHLKLKELETDKEQMNGQMKYHQDKVSELESTLSQSSSIKSELEAEIKNLMAKLEEAENLLQVMCGELNVKQEKLEGIENDLKVAGRREVEIMEKLKSSEIRLEEQEKVLEEGMAKTTELESLNATLIKDSDLKLQEAVKNLTNKESEMEETEKRAAQSLAENELLAETNSQLKSKVNELQQLSESAAAEREESARELASHMNRITESSGIVESRKVELDQTLVKVQDQEKMIVVLKEKLEQAETHTVALAEANMKLNEELAMSESKLNDLQFKLSAAVEEKNDTVQNINSSVRIVEDLTQELASERQRLQAEISSITEQKQHLSETNVAAQNQLLQLEGQLKERKESNEAFKAELEILRLEAAQNSNLQARLKELEEKLQVTEAGFRKEVESAAAREVELTSRQELEKDLASAQNTISVLKEEKCKLECAQESAAKQTSEELEAKTQQVVLLEKHVKELKQKLNEESMISKSKEKGDEVEVRSREIGSNLSSPMKSGSSFTQTSSASTEIQHKIIEEPSTLHNIKLVLGVALVSIIIGLILGKRY